MNAEELNAVSRIIITSCLEVHKVLGPGLLESVYEKCLSRELLSRNLYIERQKKIPFSYKGECLSMELKIDILVEQSIILELKCIEKFLPVHEAQLLSYLKLTNKKLGFLLNFNVPLMKNGIRRMVFEF